MESRLSTVVTTMSGLTNILTWWRKNPVGLSGRWLAAMALVAIVGGWSGHLVQNLGTAPPADGLALLKLVLDSFVQTLQLFTLGTSVNPGAANWPLTIGRTMGAIVAGATVLALLGNAFRRDVTAWMVRRMRGHTILCGLGDRNRALALDIAKQKPGHMVAIDSDSSRSNTDFCHAHDIRLLAGNAKEKETLRLSNPKRASRAFVVTGDDERNLAIVRQLAELAEGGSDAPPLAICVAVDNLALADRIATDPAFTRSASSRAIEITLFAMARLAARDVLERGRFAERAYALGLPRIRIVMLGISDTQVETLLQFLRLSPLPELRRPRIDLVVPDVDDAIARLAHRSPALAGLVRPGPDDAGDAVMSGGMADIVLHALPLQALAPGVPSLTSLGIDPAGTDVTACIVAFERQDSTFLAATELREVLGRLRRPVPIFAHLPMQSSLDPVLGEPRSDGFPPVTPFGRVGDLCRLDTFEGEREARARSLHAFYRARAGSAAAAAADWTTLPELYRQSSRRAIDHLSLKEMASKHLAGEARLDLALRTMPRLIDLLAETEHESWRIERQLDGWRFGPARDDVARLHPDLVPFADLPEPVKEANREIVRKLASFQELATGAESPTKELSGSRPGAPALELA